MEKFKDGFIKYGMEDNPDDYDEYEEEVIERDEEYDPEDEEYDEEYDDGEYDEEEYDDEGYEDDYGDEEYYDDENYDENYDDNYYDDRFNQVLDEIADLKRSVGGAPAVVQQPVAAQVPPYVITANQPYVGGDIGMYNEISRLRDELSRTQNEQSLHLELNRLKEQMEKEQKQNEAALQGEIKRLHEKLDEMEGGAVKNDKAPVRSFAPESANEIRSDIQKLVSINETVLKASKESDGRLQSQISEIRKRISSLPDFSEINKSIESLKANLAKSAGGADNGISKEIEQLKELLKSAGGNEDLERKIDALKFAASAPLSDNSEILRQVYELKSLIGSPSQNSTRHNAIVLELYNEFNKFKFDIESSSYSLGDKLVMLDKFAKKLSQSSEPEADDIYHALVDISDGLLSVKADSRSLEALNQLADQTKSVSVSGSVADAVGKYADLCDRFERTRIEDSEDIVNELIDTAVAIQGNLDKLQSLRRETASYFEQLKSASTGDAIAVADLIKKKIQPILSLTAKDIVSYRLAKPPRMYKSSKLVEENEALFDKIEELKNAVSGLNVRSVAGSDDPVVSAPAVDITPILNDLKTIKNQISAADISDELLGRIADLKNDYNDIIDRLNEMSAPEDASEEAGIEPTEQEAQVLDDLNYIKTKLEDQDTFISQIADLRADVLSIPIPADINEANNKLCDDIVAQLDKLYEDLAAVSVESLSQLTTSVTDLEANSTAKLDEISAKIDDKSSATESKLDGISASVTDILSGYDKMSTDIADIKEHVYLKELAPDAEALAASEEEKSTLLKEIADIRERLAATEEIAKEQNDNIVSQTNLVLDEIENLKAATQSTDAAAKEPVTLDEATVLTLSDITDKLNEVLYGAADSSVDNIQTILAEIAEVKEKVLAGTGMEDDIVKIMDDLSFIRNQIEVEENREDTLSENLTSEEISIILEDLATIKESLATDDEFDTAAEIVSLREDIKAARILDQDEVVKELDTLRSELAKIQDDLKQITDIRSELNVYHDEVITSKDAEPQGETMPTNEEVNMILGEIVSLRDEIQAFKDDFNASNVPAEEAKAEDGEKYGLEDSVNALYDEVLNFKTELQTQNDETASAQAEELKNIRESVDELTNVVSRRTSVVETDDAAHTANSDELNIVLDEIINLKDAIAEVKNDLEQVKAEQNSTLDVEVQSIKDMLMQLLAEKEEERSAVAEEPTGDAPRAESDAVAAMYDEIVAMREQLAQLSEAKELSAHGNDEVLEEIALLKEEVSALAQGGEHTNAESGVGAPEDGGENFNILFNEIAALREEIAANVATEPTEESDARNDGINAVLDEIAALKEQIAQLSVPAEATDAQENISDSANILFDEITALREQVLNIAETKESDAQTVNALFDEMSQIREQLSGTPVAAAPVQDNSDAILGEIAALREELDTLKEFGNQTADNGNADMLLGEVSSLRSDFESVRSDIKALNEEPDLSVINEILALRDEFQAFKDEISEAKKRESAEPETEDKTNEELLEQVRSLRDQLFAISMANINDGTGGEGTFESYNNIILDEIASLHDEVNSLKAPETLTAVIDEIAQIKESIAQDKTGDLRDQIIALKKDVESLKDMETTDATNDAVLKELSDLKTELENQREADATTLNFMSEMAHLLERQNQYINQVASTKLSSEMETLKNEIAASLSAVPSLESGNSQIMNEIAALKEEISQNSGEPVVIDNSQIIEELAKLKDEISREKDSEENRLILDEISRIKDELSAIAEKEQKSDEADKNLSKSIHDLKAELNQIADFVSVEDTAPNENKEEQSVAPAKKPAAKKPTQKKQSGAKKPAQKSGAKKTAVAKTAVTKKKSSAGQARKKPVSPVEPAPTQEIPEQTVELSGEDLLSKIDAESEIFAPVTATADSGIALSIADDAMKADDMDIADKLAHQVANKLIMEQLVQQLGDGGVPSDKVDEIVKDILPQEFTTVAIDAQTDKVRRLANSLVLDKLRARLTGKK